MNKENIQFCIEVMEQAKKYNSLYMPNFHVDKFDQAIEIQDASLEDLHTCGNRACFYGHLELMPKFVEFVVAGDFYGSPTKLTKLAGFLDIDKELADAFIYGLVTRRRDVVNDYSYPYSEFYESPWASVTPDHVIAKLNQLLNGELH